MSDGTKKIIIEVRGLTKRFDDVLAVDKASFDVYEGEILGFLGPNGAGKTTTINMLTGLARPNEGSIKIAGIDCSKNPKAAQHLVGIVPDESNLYPELTGFENLTFCASLYGIRRAERTSRARELLAHFDLADAADRKFQGYSKGMKRKLTIAAGIIHRPPILFLDEPTTGIDVASARRIRQLIADLNAGGTTIFLTTHYIEEAERLCERIAFIVEGKVVRVESTYALLEQVRGRHVVQFAVDSSDAGICRKLTEGFPGVTCEAISKKSLRVESADPIRVGPLVRILEDSGLEVSEARKINPSLEEVFVSITGIEADAMKQEREKGKGKGNA